MCLPVVVPASLLLLAVQEGLGQEDPAHPEPDADEAGADGVVGVGVVREQPPVPGVVASSSQSPGFNHLSIGL